MVCPKCKSEKTQIISNTSTKFYCVNCNHSWDTQNKIEPKGTLDFSGVISAKRIFEVLTKGQEFTPEFRAALETQITAIIFDQWFSGFKAGQMASILYSKEFYGKNRDETNSTVSGSEGRDDSTSGENIRVEGKTGHAVSRTRIGPVELISHLGVEVPESIEKMISYLAHEVWGGTSWIKSLTYENKKLKIDINTEGNIFT
jgi:hypothetical protein